MANFLKKIFVDPFVRLWNWIFDKKHTVQLPAIDTVLPENIQNKWESMGWSFIPERKSLDGTFSVDPLAVRHISNAVSYLNKCGISMLLARIPYITYEMLMQILDTCRDNGVKFVVWAYELSYIYSTVKSSAKKLGMSEMESAREAYGKIESIVAHEALHAIYLYDEPNFSFADDPMKAFFDITRDHARLSGIAKAHHKKIYINLFPNHATEKQIGIGIMPFARGTFQAFTGEKAEFTEARKEINSYRDYIETFMPYTDILSSDCYQVRMHDKNNYIVQNTKVWYKYLATMLEKHKEHPEKEFRLYIQTARYGNEFPTLTENSLKLQSYGHMMAGVSGLQYWSVMDLAVQDKETGEVRQTHSDAPLLMDGTPNPKIFEMVSLFNNSDKFKIYEQILPNEQIDNIYYFDNRNLYSYIPKRDELYKETEEERIEQYIKKITSPSFIAFSDKYCMILNLSMINRMEVKLQPGNLIVEGSKSSHTENNDGKYTIPPGELILICKNS